MATFAMSVYNIRNGHRVFSKEMDEKWMSAAMETNSNLVVLVDMLGDNPEGRPIRRRLEVNGPGNA